MRHGLWSALVLAPLALGATGCNNGGGSGIDFGDLTPRFGQAYCGLAMRCGSTPFLEQYVLHTSISDCATQTATFFSNTQFGLYQEAIDAGTILYDADHAQQCVDAFSTAACGGSGTPAVCEQIFNGTVMNGGACSIDEECANDDTQCTATGTSCGTCVALAAVGQPCGATATCVAAAYCSGTTCAARVASGGTCTSTNACATGLACTSGTCMTPTAAAAGQPCISGGCQTGLVCALMGTTTMCRAPRTDGTCQGLVSGGSDCPSGMTCSAGVGMDGTCGAYPALGDPCTTVCGTPARCVSHVCHSSLQLGEACDSGDDCISTNCEGGTCQAQPLCSP